MPQCVNRRSFLQLLGKVGGGALSGQFLEAQQSFSLAQPLLGRRVVQEHPRLHLNGQQWDALRASIHEDPLLNEWFRELQRQANAMMKEPPAQFKLIGPRLLNQSRIALRHIGLAAGLYRLDRDEKKAEFARRELHAICSFPTWHPAHFLDVAEMTNAAALGYDWLYDVLSEEERGAIREKILEFGLRPGLQQFADNADWTRVGANNWGQVCNGGLTLGALAIAGDGADAMGKSPSEPYQLLHLTTQNIRNSVEAYSPDGGWPEGPGYWAYATRYTCYMLSALQSAFGSDFEIGSMPGFSQTGLYRIAMIGPTGKWFNYADCDERPDPAPEMLWLAKHFQKPAYAAAEHVSLKRTGLDIFHLIWAQSEESKLHGELSSLDAVFKRIQIACFRSDWKDPNAMFIGFKGGSNRASHGHLDLGSFVLDAAGYRWALDPGPDNYDLPGYFGRERFSYYHLRTEGHNTLTLGTANQELSAQANIVAYRSDAHLAAATVDLSAAYGPVFSSVKRTFELQRGARPVVVVMDEVEGGRGQTFRWNFHTRAAIEVHGNSARLRLGDASLIVSITQPTQARFEVIPANAPPPQQQDRDLHALIIQMPVQSDRTKLTVQFEVG